jgi:hypothetical protein
MENAQLEKIWNEIQSDVANRSKGSFKRAIWYGNDSKVFGQNKGLRKAIRNAPKNVTKGAIGAGLGAAQVPPGLSDAISAAADLVLSRSKDMYSAHVKGMIKGNRPQSAEEALRKNIKSSVKDLKGNAFQVIDRNLVKLKDAKNKVSPAIQVMMKAQSHISFTSVPSNVAAPTNEEQAKKAEEALRAVAETQYYIDKVTTLIKATETSCAKLVTDLSTLKAALEKTQDDVSGYVKEHC